MRTCFRPGRSRTHPSCPRLATTAPAAYLAPEFLIPVVWARPAQVISAFIRMCVSTLAKRLPVPANRGRAHGVDFTIRSFQATQVIEDARQRLPAGQHRPSEVYNDTLRSRNRHAPAKLRARGRSGVDLTVPGSACKARKLPHRRARDLLDGQMVLVRLLLQTET